MMNQKDAVYQATYNVLADNDITFEDHSDITEVMTKEYRTLIICIVCEGFKAGEVQFKDTPANKEKLGDDGKLKEYVSGLVSNWHRKDKRFNGNTTYKLKNPGSRAGQGDEQLKALRALYKQFKGVDDGKATEIQTAIDTRVGQIRTEKAKQVQVNIDALPAELVESLGLTK